jgi:hypothetical protein
MLLRTGSRAMTEAHPGRVGSRLAAIVAADVAGYSRLMGLDEVGTARTLRKHRKVTDALVAKHGGRLVKTTGEFRPLRATNSTRHYFNSTKSPGFQLLSKAACSGP